MIATQRYPDLFDGVVAGAPAMRTNYSNLATRWITTSLNTAAPKDAQGKSQTRLALSTSDRKLFMDAVLKSCDALDGAKDGMIFNTRACAFDPMTLACPGAKTDSCLSTAQATAIKQGFAGPKSSRGRQVYPGFLYDTGITAEGAGIPGLLVTGFSPEGDNPTGTTMDIDAAAAEAHDGRSMAGDTNAWTNLSGFTAHGGKLIFYHGNSDPWFSALETVRYYEQMARDNGPAAVQDWSRLFLVPGMGHCRGGEAGTGPVRHGRCDRQLGREAAGPRSSRRHRHRPAGPQPAAVPLPPAPALHGQRRHRAGRQLPLHGVVAEPRFVSSSVFPTIAGAAPNAFSTPFPDIHRLHGNRGTSRHGLASKSDSGCCGVRQSGPACPCGRASRRGRPRHGRRAVLGCSKSSAATATTPSTGLAAWPTTR
jgi:hypothetical protein